MSRFNVDMSKLKAGAGDRKASIATSKVKSEERDLIKRRSTIADNVVAWINQGRHVSLVDNAKTLSRDKFIEYCDDTKNGYSPALKAIAKYFGATGFQVTRSQECGNLYDVLRQSQENRNLVRGITADNRQSTIPIVPSIAATKSAPARARGTRKLKAGMEHTELTEENYANFADRARGMSRQEFVNECRGLEGRIAFVREAIRSVTPDGELHGFPPFTKSGVSVFEQYCGLFHDRVHGRNTPGVKYDIVSAQKGESKRSTGETKRSTGETKRSTRGSTKGSTKSSESKGDSKRSTGAGAGAGRKRFQDLQDEDELTFSDVEVQDSSDLGESDEEEVTPTPPTRRRFDVGAAEEVTLDADTPVAGGVYRAGAGAGAGTRGRR